MTDLIDYLYIIPAALLAIMCHEIAHGFVSYLLGDPTAKQMGRLTLNPLKHIDPIGALSLILFRVGWAKPVMIDPRYYKNPKWGTALVSLAGPLTNFVLAIISAFLYFVIYKFINIQLILNIFLPFFLYLAILNIGLGLFNLIPIPPLDGSKIIGAILPNQAYYQYMKYQRYGTIFMLILILVINILSAFNVPSIFNEAINYIFSLIFNFWNNIFF